jgi:hypothetical protein
LGPPQAVACGVQAAAVRGGYLPLFDDTKSPILGIFGAHGGGKTTRTLFTKRLLDQDMSDFITPDNDVLRKARHRGIVAFDNQSTFPKDFSDIKTFGE